MIAYQLVINQHKTIHPTEAAAHKYAESFGVRAWHFERGYWVGSGDNEALLMSIEVPSSTA